MPGNTQKQDRVALLARNEGTYGVDAIAPNLGASPSAYQTDALLVSDLDIVVNADTLERPNYSPSLSPDSTGIGRMLAQLTFRTELRASGQLGVAPRIGRLLKACGTAETTIAAGAATQISNGVAGPSNSTASIASIISGLTKTTAPTTIYDTYRITVTTGGAPATAKYIVTSQGFPEGDASVLNSLVHTYATNSLAGVITIGGTLQAPTFTFSGTWALNDFIEIFVGGIRFWYQVQSGDTVTVIATAIKTLMLADGRFTGTNNSAGVLTVALTAANGEITTSASTQAVTLGNSGAVITLPVWTGSVNAGEYFEVTLRRPGVRYDPVSDNHSSCTFYVYLDGSLHRLRGGRGTFSIEGAAAQYPMISWTFTCIYDDPIDGALPTSLSFEMSKPWKVELAQLNIFGLPNACASRFTFDVANELAPKDCINASEAYDEITINDRVPTLGADPESTKASIFHPWTRMRREDTSRFHVAVGVRGGTGNIVRIQANRTSYTGAPFANRNKIRAHNYGFRAARVSGAGDDEFMMHFG